MVIRGPLVRTPLRLLCGVGPSSLACPQRPTRYSEAGSARQALGAWTSAIPIPLPGGGGWLVDGVVSVCGWPCPAKGPDYPLWVNQPQLGLHCSLRRDGLGGIHGGTGVWTGDETFAWGRGSALRKSRPGAHSEPPERSPCAPQLPIGRRGPNRRAPMSRGGGHAGHAHGW